MNALLFRQRFPAGAVIFNEGEEGDCAYIIDEGRVALAMARGGERVLLDTLAPGGLFGEMAIIDDSPRLATATAIEACVLTVIPREQVRNRLRRADPVVRMLMEMILARYRHGLRATGSVGGAAGREGGVAGRRTRELAIEQIRLEGELRGALEQGQLDVHFQPVLGLPERRLVGFEALARWNHPRHGPLQPDDFIGLAEVSGLIVPIGQYVLERSCAQIGAFQQARDHAGGRAAGGAGPEGPSQQPLHIGVNVSGRQLEETGFIDRVAETAERSGVPPRTLHLEITESLAVDHEPISAWIRAARGHGFGVALDDFGAGYSCLGRLLDLDFDTLKIDKAFITAMSVTQKARELVRGIVTLGHGLGVEIVAEGVEDEGQLLQLEAMGVHGCQGFLIGRPVSGEAAQRALAAGA